MRDGLCASFVSARLRDGVLSLLNSARRDCENASDGETSDSQISMLNSGCLRQFLRIADPDHTPALDNVMTIGNSGERLHILVDDEDRLAAGAQALQRPPDFFTHQRR